MTIMSGPYDMINDDDNNDVLYVGDPDDLPYVWAESTTLMPDDVDE